ncbi:MAG: hypothetical protein WDM94_13895 [Bauldia sp.]
MRFAVSALLLAVAVTPAMAGPSKIIGYGDVGAGGQTLSDSNGNWGMPRFAGDAAVNIPISERFNLEFEAWGDTQYGQYYYFGHAAAGTFVHAYARSEAGSFGAFGGYTNLEFGGYEHGDMFTGGVEGQGYFGNLTLYGQVAGLTSKGRENDILLTFNGWLARGTARYFATPDTRLQFDAQWMSLSLPTGHGDVLSLVGTAEHRFAATPFSAFVSGRWDRVSHDPFNFSAAQVTFGARFYFGGNAFENDRSGATMDTLPMPALWLRPIT